MLSRLAVGLAIATGWGTPSQADIAIGVAGPMEGLHRSLGVDVRQAAEAAVDDINAKGGVLGQRLRVVAVDDRCDSKASVAAAQRLIEEQVTVVVGHPCAAAAIAAAPIYAKSLMPLIVPGVRHPGLTSVQRAGTAILRLSGRDDRQGSEAATWLAAHAGDGGIVVIQDRTTYARTLTADITAALAGAGSRQAPTIVPFVAGERDYPAIATRIRAVMPRAAFFAGYPAEADIIVRGLRAAGIDIPVLGSDSLATQEFTTSSVARDDALWVMLRNEPTAADPVPPSLSQAVARAGASQSVVRQSYAAVLIWAEAATRAGSWSPDRVSGELVHGAYDAAPIGPLTFDERGDARVTSFAARKWGGQAWVLAP